jgi:hypothetical protein
MNSNKILFSHKDSLSAKIYEIDFYLIVKISLVLDTCNTFAKEWNVGESFVYYELVSESIILLVVVPDLVTESLPSSGLLLLLIPFYLHFSQSRGGEFIPRANRCLECTIMFCF